MNKLRDLEQIPILQDSTLNNKEARDANSVPVIKKYSLWVIHAKRKLHINHLKTLSIVTR